MAAALSRVALTLQEWRRQGAPSLCCEGSYVATFVDCVFPADLLFSFVACLLNTAHSPPGVVTVTLAYQSLSLTEDSHVTAPPRCCSALSIMLSCPSDQVFLKVTSSRNTNSEHQCHPFEETSNDKKHRIKQHCVLAVCYRPNYGTSDNISEDE